MADKQIIEQFSIDLLLNSPQFNKQLDQVSARVQKAAQNIENRLKNAFNLKGKGAALFQKDLQRTVKNTETAARNINKLLTNAFNTRGSGNNFTNWVKQAQRASAEVEQAVGRANRRMGGTGRSGSGAAGGSGAARLTSEQRLERQYRARIARMSDSVHAQMYGSTMDRLQRGGHTEQAKQFRSDIRDAYVRNRGNSDTSAFRREVREAVSSQRSFLNSQRNIAGSLDRAAGAADGLTGGFGRLAAGVISLQAAVQYFKGSLVEGQKRTQAKTMLGAAYGNNAGAITEQVNTYADKFGMDKAEAQQQAAILRQTLPASLFKDKDIPQLMQTESIFGHQTGMTNDAIGRLNYVLPQIAASTHLMMQDWMQVSNAAPAITKPLMELTGTKNIGELKEKAKAMSGAEFAKLMVTAMEMLANNATVASAAMNSMQANIGRYTNAVRDGQESFFDGYSDGFKNLLGSMVNLFENSLGTLYTTGDMLGNIFDNLADMVVGIGNNFIHTRGYVLQFLDVMNEGFRLLPKKGQDGLGDVGNLAVQGGLAFAGYKTFTGIFKMFGLLKSVATAATATEAVATTAVASTGVLANFLKAFRLGPLAEFILIAELAGNADKLIGSANTLREKMGFSKTKGFSDKAHAPDANAYDKIMGYNPSELWDWFKSGIADSPLMQGNWTGAVSPGGMRPITPFLPNVAPSYPQKGMQGEVTIKVEGANGQIVGSATLNAQNNYSASLRGNMREPWSEYSPSVPLTRPQQ